MEPSEGCICATTGAKLAAALNLQVVNFLTDNEMVATAAQQNSLRLSPGHWSLRPILAELATITQGMQRSIIKVRRETNKVTDKLRLGKQVLQALVCIPVKRLHTLVLVMCNRHFRTFNGDYFAPSLYYVYN
jgi:hypothetical protein